MPRLAAIGVALLLSMATFGATTASARPASLSGTELRGQATFRFLGIPLYDARLFTQGGAALNWQDAFGLELTYRKKLTQYDLVESTMRELNRTGAPMAVRAKLEGCFRDVQKGDQFLAVTSGPDQVKFWFNGSPACTLTHPQITARFMGIFLGENSRSASFTRRLKGE